MIFIRFLQPRSNPVVVQVFQSNCQFVASILFLVTIMALLICSNETNITMFHEPNLRNEGTNLQETKFVVKSQSCNGSTNVGKHFYQMTSSANDSWTNESVLGSERKRSPFVESCGPLFGQHGPGAVDSALVLAWWWVHVSSFHHIHRGGDHCGNKAGTERRNKVARQIVWRELDTMNQREWVTVTRGPLFWAEPHRNMSARCATQSH